MPPACGRAWTIDAPFRETVGGIQRHRGGVLVVEMEAAAIFALAKVGGTRRPHDCRVGRALRRDLGPAFDDERYPGTLQAAASVVLDCAAAGWKTSSGGSHTLCKVAALKSHVPAIPLPCT